LKQTAGRYVTPGVITEEMMNNRAVCALAALLAILAVGCEQPQSAGSPFELFPPIPPKNLLTNGMSVEFICYVDPERENPLNVQDYYFEASRDYGETQLFNYVVLAYSYLTKDSQGYIHLELSPALKYILENSVTFIKPLHQNGIRVLIEVRSGNFADTEDGLAVGFGTMDMACINEFIKELKSLVEHYGLDGFDFNDVGGGKKAYPPLTRELRQFRSDQPLYVDLPDKRLFTDSDNNPLPAAEIENNLWIEGGSNFSNFIQRLNETLKQTYTSVFTNGSHSTESISTVERSILVRGSNHGRKLLSQLRDAYMPDAYSGADPKVNGNLKYVINDIPGDVTFVMDHYELNNPHAAFWDEAQRRDAGVDLDDKYAPFTVDLSDPKDRDTARLWANAFLLKDPAAATGAANQNRYGALYVSHLQPASVSNMALYLTYFTRVLFGRTVQLRAGGGNYQKTW
jgi:hypothetical protein